MLKIIKSMVCMQLKGPKHEIFNHMVFCKKIRLVWVCDVELGQKLKKFLWLEAYILILISEYFLRNVG